MKKIFFALLVFSTIYLNSCSQELNTFEMPNGYQISYSDQWSFIGDQNRFRVKFNNSIKDLFFHIKSKVTQPYGCNHAKKKALSYSNTHGSLPIEDVAYNNWTGFRIFRAVPESSLNKSVENIWVKSGSLSWFSINVSGAQEDLKKHRLEIEKLLETLILTGSEKPSEVLEIQLLKDSLGSELYKTNVHNSIINGLLRCNSVKVNGFQLDNMLEYFKWKSASTDQDMRLSNYRRILDNIDFSQFTSLVVEGDFPSLVLNFHDEVNKIFTIEFMLSEPHTIPLNEKIILRSFYFNENGGLHFDRINQKLIEGKPVVYINGDVYAVVFKKGRSGINIH